MSTLSSYNQYYRGYTTPIVHFLDATQANYINTGAANITVDLPDGVVAGDLLVIVGVSRNSYIGEPEAGGWNEVCDLGIQGSGGTPVDPSVDNDNLYAWYKRAGASESASFAMLITDDGTDAQCVHCIAFRNGRAVTGYAAGGAKIGQSLTVTNGGVLLSVHATAFSATSESTVAAPPEMVLIDKQYNATNDAGSAVAFEHMFAGGASGTRTWVSSWDGTDSVITVNFSIDA